MGSGDWESWVKQNEWPLEGGRKRFKKWKRTVGYWGDYTA